MLTTVTAVRDEMGGDFDIPDSALKRKIRVYSDLFQRICDRDLVFGTDVAKVALPSRRKRLSVPNTPVTEVLEIRYRDEVIPEDKWTLEDASCGFIKRVDQRNWASTAFASDNVTRSPQKQPLHLYEVEYEGGYVTPQQAMEGMDRTLPYDIEDAVIAAVVAGVSQQGIDSGIAQISVGDASTRWSSEVFSGMGRQVPTYFEEVADRYKRVTIL